MGLFKKLKRRFTKTNSVLERLRRDNFISPSAHLSHANTLELGGNVYIGADCRFYCEGGLRIGKSTQFGRECMILTTNHNYANADWLPYDDVGILQRVEIGENCWFGVRCTILSGVKIEDGAVIAAGSVVTKSVPRCAIVGGNPARIIGWRDTNHYEQLAANNRSYVNNRPIRWQRKSGFKPIMTTAQKNKGHNS